MRPTHYGSRLAARIWEGTDVVRFPQPGQCRAQGARPRSDADGALGVSDDPGPVLRAGREAAKNQQGRIGPGDIRLLSCHYSSVSRGTRNAITAQHEAGSMAFCGSAMLVCSAGGELGELIVQGSAFGVGLGEFECASVCVARFVVPPGATKQLSAG
jgi:hypothetical protein